MPVYLVGEPADVVTNLTPWSITNSAMAGSRTKAWAMFTPNGASVRSRILRISSFTVSSSPDDVSMIPHAPHRLTAEASCDRAIQPIGAWTIGIGTPRSRDTRLSNARGRSANGMADDGVALIAPSCRPGVVRTESEVPTCHVGAWDRRDKLVRVSQTAHQPAGLR